MGDQRYKETDTPQATPIQEGKEHKTPYWLGEVQIQAGGGTY